GIQPDCLICRSNREIPLELKSKIGLFCSVRPENVIAATDYSTIYEVPLVLHAEKFDEKVVARLGLDVGAPALSGWEKMVATVKSPEAETSIGIVGKYVDLKESYKSLNEAITHGAIANSAKVNIAYIDSESLTYCDAKEALAGVDGVLVPGGFGERGA